MLRWLEKSSIYIYIYIFQRSCTLISTTLLSAKRSLCTVHHSWNIQNRVGLGDLYICLYSTMVEKVIWHDANNMKLKVAEIWHKRDWARETAAQLSRTRPIEHSNKKKIKNSTVVSSYCLSSVQPASYYI